MLRSVSSWLSSASSVEQNNYCLSEDNYKDFYKAVSDGNLEEVQRWLDNTPDNPNSRELLNRFDDLGGTAIPAEIFQQEKKPALI